MATQRVKTYRRNVDVAHPLFREAEDRFKDWYEKVLGGTDLTDVRPLRTYHDFTIGGMWTVDVKCDQYALQTGRVAWEEEVFHFNPKDASDITKNPGWGMHDGLDYIVYVFPQGEGTWPAIMVDARVMREAIMRLGTSREYNSSLKRFAKESDDRTATGFAVDIEWLEEVGAIRRRFYV